jgi:hypothetical protein
MNQAHGLPEMEFTMGDLVKRLRRYSIHYRGNILNIRLERLRQGVYRTTINQCLGQGSTIEELCAQLRLVENADFTADSNRQAVAKHKWWMKKHYPRDPEVKGPFKIDKDKMERMD